MRYVTVVPLKGDGEKGDGARATARTVTTMGVRLLARTTTSPLSLLEQRLEALGSRPTGRHKTMCSYMRPRAEKSGLQEIFDIAPSETGERYLVSHASDGAIRVLRAGSGIAAIIDATNTHTSRVKVSLEGHTHACGDFVIRASQFFHNGKLSGVCVELEYLPCGLAAAAAAPLQALLDRLLPEAERDFCSASSECFSGVLDLPQLVGPEHSALLLVGLLRSRVLMTAFGDRQATTT